MLLIYNIIVMSGLFYTVHYKALDKVKENIKWYTNHAITNCLMVLTTYSDSLTLLDCRQDCHLIKPTGGPLYRWYGYNDIEFIMLTNVIILHFYHIFCFQNLRVIDYIHHIVMMITLTCAYMMNIGIYMSYFLFFTCGLPGTIDYSMLAIGYNRREEKRINTYLNNYLRAPGVMFGLGLLWKDIFHFSSLTIFMSFLAMFWNAQYFNYEVIKSYYIR